MIYILCILLIDVFNALNHSQNFQEFFARAIAKSDNFPSTEKHNLMYQQRELYRKLTNNKNNGNWKNNFQNPLFQSRQSENLVKI